MITVVIDSREQHPYEFEKCVTKKLNTGDYSIQGAESEICIERKTKSDAYGTIGRGRARFIKELERMMELRYSAIIIESSFSSFLKPPRFSQLHPNSAIQSLITWSVRYNVHVFFCDNRIMGNYLTLSILEKFEKEINESIN
jgi:DNA excision repair protein ERCC-4